MIIVPPPLIYFTALLLGAALQYFWPLEISSGHILVFAGIAFVIPSILIMPPVLSRYRKANTPFDVRKPAALLITDGPYRYSRNPSYVSITLFYIGITLLVNNVWLFVLLIPVLLIMDRWIILAEERQLEALFGDAYLRYKISVRRWL